MLGGFCFQFPRWFVDHHVACAAERPTFIFRRKDRSVFSEVLSP
jgi:hypothetical protein